jgi:hypothetical protein
MIQVDQVNKEVYLTPAAYKYSGFCEQVVTPFSRVVDLGILSPGTYKIYTTGNSQALETITVKPTTTESPDDYPYAPVVQAFFKQQGLISNVLIAGEFTNSCQVIDEVRVSIQPKVLVVQPIIKREQRADCQNGSFPFYKVEQIDLLPVGKYLLHVRSSNGQAVNTLVEVK